MPLVSAAGYRTAEAPTVSPAPSPGNDYQQIAGVTPDAFGASVGRAQSGLGQTLEHAGNVLAENVLAQQRLTNQVASDNATNYVMDETSKLLHGDPNIPGDTGYYGKKGIDAVNDRQKTAKSLDDLINGARTKLSNPRQQLEFDNQTRRMRNYWLGEIGRHYDQQLTTSAVNSAKAGQALAGQGMATTAANGDEAGFTLNVENYMKAAQREGQAKGWTQEELDAEFGKIRGTATSVWVESKAVTDPVGAKAFLEHNKDALIPGEYRRLEQMVKTHADHLAANQFVDKILTPGSGGLVRGGAIQGRISKDQAYQLAIKAGFRGQAADTMAAISMAESSGNPGAIGDREIGGSFGLTQINLRAHGDKAKEALNNPERAFELAYEVSKGGTTFSPWTMYRNGEYKKHLGGVSSEPTVTPADSVINVAGQNGVMYPLTQVQFKEYSGIKNFVEQQKFLDTTKTTTSKFGVDSLGNPTLNGMPAPPPPLVSAAPTNRTGLPTLNEQFDMIDRSNLTDEQKEYAKDRTTKRFTALEAEASRTHRIKTEADHEAVTSYTNKVLQDVYSPNPQITPTMIMNAPELASDPTRKEHLVAFINNPPGSTVPAAQSNAHAMSLIKRMQPNYTKEDKITSMGQILDEIGGLNRTDFSFVQHQFQEQQKLGGEGVRQQRSELLSNYEGQIVGLIKDKSLNPQGYARLFRYQHFIQSKIDDYQKSGKNPADLFDPNNPAFVASPETLKAFQASPAELLRDPQTGQAVDLTKYSDTDLIAAAKQGKVDRNLARIELARRIDAGLTKPPTMAPIR